MTRRPARWRRARDEGFTLVESVVATTLFGIFAATLLTFVMGTFRMSVETQRRLTATHLASGSVAEARELAARPAVVAGGPAAPSIDLTFLDGTSVVDVGGTPFQVTRTSRAVTAAGDDVCEAGLSGAAAAAALVEVTVEVSWSTGSAPVRLVERAALAGHSFVVVRVHDETAPVAGVKVELLTSAQRTGGTPTASSTTTSAGGCAVFEVDPAADPAPYYWYAVQAGDASSASAQYVTADGRFSTGAQYLGRAEAGIVRSAVVEVRREATLRFTVLDAAGDVLTGEPDDIEVTLVATDGHAGRAEQVRSTAETAETPVADDRSQASWRYPMRHRDVATEVPWWEGGGTPVVSPSAVTITTHPVDQEVEPGGTATFDVEATGDGTLHVLWQVSSTGGYSWYDLDQGDELTQVQLAPGLVLPDGTADLGRMSVRAVVSNELGHAVSLTARVLLTGAEEEDEEEDRADPTVITVPPTDQDASVGDAVVLEVAAEGEGPFDVVWQCSSDRGLTWTDVAAEVDMWTWTTPALTAGQHLMWCRAVVIGTGGIAVSPPATISLFAGTREFVLRALWPADYTLWIGSRPGALVPVPLQPGRGVDVLLHQDGSVLAVRDADGVVTTSGDGAP
ncbi:prepilin-type N-terminal cleavage/methylation domain-containing protein [Cellulomonas sp. Y8]|uniref:prepilin-type N-terminal cleavage/methylation domain-containing protein n=1 Tax=Cellulomonas sp. Y8 TaxID=2591145 RepID=UPI00143D4E28|nr:prepilin-type N-terminal cleavage/methylation domain-containing protein [Cellulomonas sp. Y8]